MICGHHCVSEDQFICKSFNFISDANVLRNCELNSKTAASVDEASFVSSAQASYFERIDAGTYKVMFLTKTFLLGSFNSIIAYLHSFETNLYHRLPYNMYSVEVR
jgi:hypothetical protein